jgi:hypothetical protein
MQESVALRTLRVAQINAILTAQGGIPLLKIFAADPPLNVAAADPSTLLCTINLPSSPLSAANGVASKIGDWIGVASQGGFAQSFRLYDSVPTCHVQGFCSEPWQRSVSYALGQNINNINGVYSCVGAGVSASVGSGPSGTGTNIADGSALWSFLWPTAEMVLGTTNLAPGLNLPVQSFSISAANA